MEIINKSNKETKQRGLGLDRQRVKLKEKRKFLNLDRVENVCFEANIDNPKIIITCFT
jgi:hypothetical protein